MRHEQASSRNGRDHFVVEQLAAEYERVGIVFYLVDEHFRPYLVKQRGYGDLSKEVEEGVWSLPAETSRYSLHGLNFIREWNESVLHRVCLEEIGVPQEKMKLKRRGKLDQRFPFRFTSYDAHLNGTKYEQIDDLTSLTVSEMPRVAQAMAMVLVYQITNPEVLSLRDQSGLTEVSDGRFFSDYEIQSERFPLRKSPDIKAINKAVYDQFTRMK